MAASSEEAGQMLRNGKCKRTVEEQQAAANDQKRAALGDISNNKDMQRCEQGISKLGVASANVQTRSMRSRQVARQQPADVQVTSAAEPMSTEQSKPDYVDIDAAYYADTQLCTAYVHQIYEHLCNIENTHRIMVHYMSSQKDINATMRGILIDWLVEVAEEYRLEPETLYLAVNYIDRFLQCVPVNRGKLQLVGVTCMLIASKYEEIHPPAVDEFVYISDNTYTRDEILRMEAGILNKLDFVLTVATPKVFLKRFFRAANASRKAHTHTMAQTVTLSEYLCELTLQEYTFLKYLPSMIAASCLLLSQYTVENEEDWRWDETMVHYTRYSLQDLGRCTHDLLTMWSKASTNSLQAVQEKYGTSKNGEVSLIRPPTSLPPMD